MCIFLTNVFQNLRKSISAKLLDGETRHGHTLSQPAHHRPASKMPFKCFRCCIAKQEERKAGEGCVGGGGGGGGMATGQRARLKPIHFCGVFLHVLLLFLYGLGGGG